MRVETGNPRKKGDDAVTTAVLLLGGVPQMGASDLSEYASRAASSMAKAICFTLSRVLTIPKVLPIFL